jgi:phosphate transport system substrate-binding protein
MKTSRASKKAMLLALLCISIAAPSLAQHVNGAGTRFTYPIYSHWFESFTKLHPSVKLHYQAVGSLKGVERFIDGEVDFAATDAPLTQEQLHKAKEKLGSDVIQIPTLLGAVVPIYKLQALDTELKFTASALADIYLGKITHWNDPELTRANPGVPLPDEKIMVVHRSEDSDSTYLWTDYLSRVSPQWKEGPGTGLKVRWPVGLGAKEDDGVEDLVIGPRGFYSVEQLVSSIPNSIGYVDLHYAIEHKLPYGDVQNLSGVFVRATESSVMQAASSVATAIPDAFRASLAEQSSNKGFPISSFTWILVAKHTANK